MRKQILLFVLLFLLSAAAFAQGNAFSFQGKLNDGSNPANGRYDLQFKLFDAITGGTQIGPTVARPGTTLINGVFSTTLDFGAVAFQNPNATFIEIAIKPFNSPNTFTILGPRQQLTVVPYASRAQNATNADNATNANTAQNSLRLGGNLAGDYYTAAQVNTGFISNSTQAQTNSNFNISGNGIVGGNLGVGGNPTSKLEVFGNIRATTAFPKITLSETSVSNRDVVIGNLDGELLFDLNSTTRMWIKPDGKVIIGGSTVPASSSLLQVTGNVDLNGTMTMNGNTIQQLTSNGLPKAMLFVESNSATNGTITRCYNGITGATTGTCGFTLTRPNGGGYQIDFGFNVLGRFPVATGSGGNNASADVRELTGSPGGTRVQVFLRNGSFDASAPFTLVLF